MERPEIVELFYSALIDPDDLKQLFPFLAPRVEWILSAADPQTLGEDLPSNAIKFSGREGFRQLALYFPSPLARDFWRPYRMYSASSSRFFVWKSPIANSGSGVGWQKRISLPKSLFRAQRSLNARLGSRGPWFF